MKITFTTSTGKTPNHAYLPNKVSAHWSQDFIIAYRNGVKITSQHIASKSDVKTFLESLAVYC